MSLHMHMRLAQREVVRPLGQVPVRVTIPANLTSLERVTMMRGRGGGAEEGGGE